MTITIFAIREKSTGFYLPEWGRGHTWVEPTAFNSHKPRFFLTRKKAAAALGQWISGPREKIVSYSDDFSGRVDHIRWRPIPKDQWINWSIGPRIKDNMEVVEFTCEEKI